MTTLILLRGLPGSGKSTRAPEAFEADKFGPFDPILLPYAHMSCLASTALHLYIHRDKPTHVANTFTQYWEMRKYFELANKFSVPVHIIHCTGEFPSVHNVPKETIDKMRRRFESNEVVYQQAIREFPNVVITMEVG